MTLTGMVLALKADIHSERPTIVRPADSWLSRVARYGASSAPDVPLTLCEYRKGIVRAPFVLAGQVLGYVIALLAVAGLLYWLATSALNLLDQGVLHVLGKLAKIAGIGLGAVMAYLALLTIAYGVSAMLNRADRALCRNIGVYRRASRVLRRRRLRAALRRSARKDAWRAAKMLPGLVLKRFIAPHCPTVIFK